MTLMTLLAGRVAAGLAAITLLLNTAAQQLDPRQAAVQAVYRCEFAEALELLAPFEGENAARLRDFCAARLRAEEEPPEASFLGTLEFRRRFPGGALYFCGNSLLYVPEVCDENTRGCIYFGGGVGDENWLYMRGVYSYFRHYSPNAVFLFHLHSHVENPVPAAERALALLERVAEERHIVLHDILTVGSSTGSLSAIRAAAVVNRDYVFPARAAIALDAPNEWNVGKNWLPTDEERELLAAAGTQLYLFEQKGVGLEKKPIAALVDAGCPVTIVECRHGDHNTISVNAYTLAVFSWGLEEIDLDADEYTLVPLSGDAG